MKKPETILYDIPQLEVIPGTRLKRLLNKVRAYSVTLGREIEIEPPFIYDEESTPWRGGNPIAGLFHDFVCRIGILESQFLAARVYLEFQNYEDRMNERPWYIRIWDFIWRYGKAGFVAICPSPVYWHKYTVHATAEEMQK
jgi:hypothetical protein